MPEEQGESILSEEDQEAFDNIGERLVESLNAVLEGLRRARKGEKLVVKMEDGPDVLMMPVEADEVISNEEVRE